MGHEIKNIHDKFFKSLLSDRDIAIDWLRTFLPQPILEQLDITSLAPASNSFITPELQESFADVVFKCKLSGSKEGYLSIILEHKSYPDEYAAIQLLFYVANAYIIQWKSKFPLEPVIPVLFYHGKENWQYRPLSSMFNKLPESIRAFVPDVFPVFVDATQMSDETFLSMGNLFLGSALLLQKYSRSPEDLVKKASQIFGSLDTSGHRNLLPTLFVYFVEMAEIPVEELNRLLETLPKSIKSDFMSTYEKILEKGIEKGIDLEKINIISKGLSNGLSLEILAELTNWPLEKVRQIAVQLKKSTD